MEDKENESQSAGLSVSRLPKGHSVRWLSGVVRRVLSGQKVCKILQVELIKWCVIDAGNRRDRDEYGHSPAALWQSRLCELVNLSRYKPLVYFTEDQL